MKPQGLKDLEARIARLFAEQLQVELPTPEADLFARLPHGTGQTVLREALVLADHNSYHLGQLVLLRRLLGAWKTA